MLDPKAMLKELTAYRDDRLDECHDCFCMEKNEHAIVTEAELVGALNHVIRLFSNIYELT
jgi:hypothetical protein